MANGYKLDKGFLFDKGWEKQMRKLTPKQFKELFWDLYDMQMNDGPKPEYDDPVMDCIADFASVQIQNRLNGAKRTPTPGGTVGGRVPHNLPTTPGGTVGGTPLKIKYNNNINIIPPLYPPQEGEGEGVTDTFERFWEAYPRKEGKQAARNAWAKPNPDIELCDAILSAVIAQSKSDAWNKENGRFIPAPAKWIAGKRWEDEVTSLAGSFNTDEFFEAALARSYRTEDDG